MADFLELGSPQVALTEVPAFAIEPAEGGAVPDIVRLTINQPVTLGLAQSGPSGVGPLLFSGLHLSENPGEGLSPGPGTHSVPIILSAFTFPRSAGKELALAGRRLRSRQATKEHHDALYEAL